MTSGEREPILEERLVEARGPRGLARWSPPRHAKFAAACAGVLGLASAGVATLVVVKPRVPQPKGVAARSTRLFLVDEPPSRTCVGLSGVQVAEPEDKVSVWPACSAKWSEDCRSSGCCADWGMQCFEKNEGWAACAAACEKVDAQNESWTCKVLAPPVPHTHEACEAHCRGRRGCKQAVFNTDAGGSCSVSSERSSAIVWAGDNLNSSFCGEAGEERELVALVEKAQGQLPFRLPELPLQNCSWGGEDCSQTRCCNNVACDAHFTSCSSYTCYKKSDYFAGCLLQEPPKSWEGTRLGGGRVHRTVPGAGAQVSVQGTSLYCFSVVNWWAPAPKPFWSTEKQLAENMKQHGLSIFQCDGYDFYDGKGTPKAAWGSFSNIDAFQEVWKQVRAKGAYRQHDWTVKVDSDAVFFPARLKMHLAKLRTPLGSRVYLENTDFQFKFMGALEVLTREALDLYLERGHECIRGKHEGGEDFFMKGCMDALGIDHQSDFDLLHDKYASQDAPCTDGWAVAYHFHKKVISWNWCYNEAVCGGRGKTCPEGVEVEFVMPWKPNGAG